MLPQACNFIKKRLTQVFSRKFCKVSKNTFFTEHLWETASERFPYVFRGVQDENIGQKWVNVIFNSFMTEAVII